MNKAQLKQLIKEVLSEMGSGDRHWLQPLDKSKITDIEFVNIDPKDAPDYKNAKIVMARYRPENNRKLTSDELEMLNKPYAAADKEFFQNALKKAVSKRAARIYPELQKLRSTLPEDNSMKKSKLDDVEYIESLLKKLRSGELVKDDILRKQLIDILSAHRDKIK